MLELNQLYNMDCMEGMKQLTDNYIDCCVTSPPYYGLRDFGVEGQIGLEETPEKYVEKIVEIFSEVKRVLKKEGTLWLNLGDSYASAGKNRTEAQAIKNSTIQGGKKNQASILTQQNKITGSLKPKDLIGIPWMVAFALRADGWYLRSDIIWNKPNPMPESVQDRPTRSHEYIFLLSKSKKYYYDQESILQDCSPNTHNRISQDLINQIGSFRAAGGKKHNGPMKAVIRTPKQTESGIGIKNNKSFNNSVCLPVIKVNKKSVWTISTKPFSEAHFAVFPQDLIVDCIKAGSPEGGIVLDPFAGTNTTGIVAKKLNRNYISIELNADYIKIAENRTHKELGLFK